MKQLIAALQKRYNHYEGIHDKGACVGLTEAIDIINTHMEGRVIVPVEITDVMIGKARRVSKDVGPDTIEDMYKAMLSTQEGE
jgi:hypothetical protein